MRRAYAARHEQILRALEDDFAAWLEAARDTDLGITAADWKAFEGILGSALEELKVPASERTELLTLLHRRFRPDVVEGR
jgi:hypothetical protein